MLKHRIFINGGSTMDTTNEAQASQWTFLKNKIKMAFKCFKQMETKKFDNVEIYKPAKSQFKI
jgi:hypothetical protein